MLDYVTNFVLTSALILLLQNDDTLEPVLRQFIVRIFLKSSDPAALKETINHSEFLKKYEALRMIIDFKNPVIFLGYSVIVIVKTHAYAFQPLMPSSW